MEKRVQIAGFAGLVFVVAAAAAAAVTWAGPGADASASAIRDHLADARTALVVGAVLTLAATVSFLIWGIVARGLAGDGPSADAILSGTIVGSIALLAGNLVVTALVWNEEALALADDGLLLVVWSLRSLLATPVAIAAVLVGSGLSGASLRHLIFPGHVGRVGLVAVAVGALGLLSPLAIGTTILPVVAQGVLLLLVALASIAMVRDDVGDTAAMARLRRRRQD